VTSFRQGSKKDVKRSWPRLLKSLRPLRALMLLGFALAGLSAAAGAVWASLLGPLVSAILVGGQGHWGSFILDAADLRWKLPAAIVGVAVFKALAGWVHGGVMSNVAQRFLRKLRGEVYATLLAQPPVWYDKHHSGDLSARFSADLNQVEHSTNQALTSVGKDALSVLALLALCFLKDWKLSLIVFLVIPGTLVPVLRFARSTRRAAQSSQGAVGAIATIAAEQLNNLVVVQAFRAEGQALSRFDAEQERYLHAMKRSLFVRGAYSPTTEFLGVLGVAAAVALGSR
jgi:ATP-binding cassette, subfamily B, bacterial MsbA